jgi:hypothetical protein
MIAARAPEIEDETDWLDLPAGVRVNQLRRLFLDYRPKRDKADAKRARLMADAGVKPKVDPKNLDRGWMTPYLFGVDALTWQRWAYWLFLKNLETDRSARMVTAMRNLLAGREADDLPPDPIPRIEFVSEGGSEVVRVASLGPVEAGSRPEDVVRQVDDDLPEVAHAYRKGSDETRTARILAPNTSAVWHRGRRMWEHSFEQVAPSWQGWGATTYIEYLLDWLLYAFGELEEQPKEPYGTKGCSERLYREFDLWPLMLAPYDHLGDLLAEMSIGRHNAFFPTPHAVVHLKAEMLFMGDEDYRLERTMDPCCGTGRQLLFASNHSLCIAGMDNFGLVVKAAKVNAWMYAPWVARSIDWVWKLSDQRHPTPEATDEPAVEPGQPPVQTVGRPLKPKRNRDGKVVMEPLW